MSGQADETGAMVPEESIAQEGSQAAPEPMDLKAAFLQYESGFKKDDSSEESPAQLGSVGAEPAGAPIVPGGEAQPQPAGDDEAVDDGEFGVERLDITGVSTEDYAKAVTQRIKAQAEREVKAQFAKDKKRKITAMDLRQVDDNGNITYYNPDNPNQPFRDNQYRNALSQAREWADNYNARVDADFRQSMNKRIGELAQAVKPTVDFIRFSNEVLPYLNDNEVECLDMLIERYEIKSRNGDVIGYNCNLYQEAAIARKMAAQYTAKQQQGGSQQQPSVPATQPAVDMNTASSTANAQATPQAPKNLNEAMKITNSKYKKQ